MKEDDGRKEESQQGRKEGKKEGRKSTKRRLHCRASSVFFVTIASRLGDWWGLETNRKVEKKMKK
jgi:hypothetical protein